MDPGTPSGAVAEITITAGTGPYQLGSGTPSGPLAAYFRFADVFLDGETITYQVDDTAKKEIVTGRFDLGGNTLSRDVVLFSSNGHALIDWPATGQRTVRPLVAFPLCDTPPTDGQVLAWDAALQEYCPITLTDDDTGTGGSGPPLCATPPTVGQILVWSAAENAYCPADLCALVEACINPPPPPGAIYLDGYTGAFYSLALSGVSAGPKLSFSFWIEGFESGNTGATLLVDVDKTHNSGGSIRWNHGAEAVVYLFEDAVGNQAFGSVTVPVDGALHNVLVCMDATTNTAIGYVDETPQDPPTFPAMSVNFITGSEGFAINDFPDGLPGASPYLTGTAVACLKDFWYAPGQFFDFSIDANRAKFHDLGTLESVSLGSTGQLPTGTAPAVFLTGGKTTFGTNLGTGGSLTAVGVVEDCLPINTAITRSGVSLIDGNIAFGFESNATFLTGDSAIGVVSAWLRASSIPSTIRVFEALYGGGIPLARVAISTSGVVSGRFTAADLATTVTFTQTTGVFPADGNWHHLIVNWDTQAGTMQIVIDRAAATVSRTGSTGFDAGYSKHSPLAILWQGFMGLTGDAAELWVTLDLSIDLSVSSNLDKFERSGATVDLGLNGELPLGAMPKIYLSQRPQGYQAMTFFQNRVDPPVSPPHAFPGANIVPIAPSVAVPAASPTVASAPYP